MMARMRPWHGSITDHLFHCEKRNSETPGIDVSLLVFENAKNART
jgi:hypothetical protein